MKRKYFDFVKEPCGEEYRKLLEYGLDVCDTVMLVLPPMHRPLSEYGKETLDRLHPFFFKSLEQVTEWPGTIVTEEYAVTLLYYRYDWACFEILKHAADSLYDWLHPNLPEDLGLVRPDGEPFLTTLSRDKASWLLLTEEEKKLFFYRFPEFEEILDWDDP